MSITLFTILLWLCSLLAGGLGALTGLGGGVVIVPLLTLAFGVNIHYAIGASLISVISTSSATAIAYVREGYSNIRIGMVLEIATTLGAICGAWIGGWIDPGAIAVIFGFVLLFSISFRAPAENIVPDRRPVDRITAALRLDGSYPSSGSWQPYVVRNVPGGFVLMYAAGILSGLLGIGSGAVKVLAMDRAMKLPFKVSTTTSNFMIGVTAAASAGIYLSRGYIDPGLAMPVVLGVLPGALIGARLLPKLGTPLLRRLFSLVLLALAIQMVAKGLWGGI